MTNALVSNASAMPGFESVARRDLIRTRWATTDAVEHRVAKAREIIGYAVGAARIPNQNSVGLPSHERHLLGSIKVLPKR